jgi:tryptophan synthase beta chain
MNYNMPDEKGYFGKHGGRFVPETLMPALLELEKNFRACLEDRDFLKELNHYLKNYVGRESPLYYAERLSDYCGGAKIYLKREDLNHTGAHKLSLNLFSSSPCL